MHVGQGHHHSRQAFIAGCDTDDGFAGRQGTDEAAHDDRSVIAVRQGIEHARRALCTAIAGVGNESGSRDIAHAF